MFAATALTITAQVLALAVYLILSLGFLWVTLIFGWTPTRFMTGVEVVAEIAAEGPDVGWWRKEVRSEPLVRNLRRIASHSHTSARSISATAAMENV